MNFAVLVKEEKRAPVQKTRRMENGKARVAELCPGRGSQGLPGGKARGGSGGGPVPRRGQDRCGPPEMAHSVQMIKNQKEKLVKYCKNMSCALASRAI